MPSLPIFLIIHSLSTLSRLGTHLNLVLRLPMRQGWRRGGQYEVSPEHCV